MLTEVDAVQNSRDFPEAVDVVVIGAGIIGTCAAYELAGMGRSVALIEKGVVAGEQSSRNWGWVRQQNGDLHELQLAIQSVKWWDEIGREVGREVGRDLGFRQTGNLICTDDPAVFAKWESWLRSAAEQGYSSELLTPAQAKERTPGSVTTWIGGVWSPAGSRAEPSMAVPAVAEGAKARGVSLHQNCAVRGLEVTNGSVRGVWTERGLIRASAVAAGGRGPRACAAVKASTCRSPILVRRHCGPSRWPRLCQRVISPLLASSSPPASAGMGSASPPAAGRLRLRSLTERRRASTPRRIGCRASAMVRRSAAPR